MSARDFVLGRLGTRRAGIARSAAVAAVAAAIALTACEGPNLFVGDERVGADERFPTVRIQQPGSGSTLPAGDSVLVAVELDDDIGIERVQISGIAFRGDPTLGTDEVVDRFQPRTVEFEELPTDTVLLRYIQPAGDGRSEPVHLIVAATDVAGNVAEDTVEVVVGAPRVEILNVENGDTVPAGGTLAIRLVASDRAGITRVRLDYSGIAEGEIVPAPFDPARDSVTVDTAIALPDGQTGSLALVATALNTLEQTGRTDTLRLQVAETVQTDTVAPLVALDVQAGNRVELLDSVRIRVDARDDTRGSGIARIGYTALAMSASANDTLVLADSVVYPSARTGTVPEEFGFAAGLRADTLSLPDTLAFEIHAYAVDAAGNCAAATDLEEERLDCGAFQDRTVAADRAGRGVQAVAVAGHTVLLPDGGQVGDAVLDADTAENRYRFYISNFTTGQVDVLRLTDSTFIGRVSVGSKPWGVFLDNSGDTLIVANSGGKNISFVPLQTGGDADHVPQELVQRRLLLPNAVLYDLEVQTDEDGTTYTIIRHGFSDQPQFVAQDSTGRYLYSTRPTASAPRGTVRLVDEDPDPAGGTDVPESRILFDAGKALEPNDDVLAVANIDSIVVQPTQTADIPVFCDHEPGYPNRSHCVAADTITFEAALDSLRTLTGDAHMLWRAASRWSLEAVSMSDTTYLAASGDRGVIAFGEGATAPTGRIMLWHAHSDPDSARVSRDVDIEDLVHDASERVLGVGLNRNGSYGVARGTENAYYFTRELAKQGEFSADLGSAGAGAALHPDHDEVRETGEAALSFIATSRRSIQVVNTTSFEHVGEIAIRDNLVGTLRASHPLPTDNDGQGAACVGEHCIIVKLYGVTSAGGVVIVDVRRRDIEE